MQSTRISALNGRLDGQTTRRSSPPARHRPGSALIQSIVSFLFSATNNNRSICPLIQFRCKLFCSSLNTVNSRGASIQWMKSRRRRMVGQQHPKEHHWLTILRFAYKWEPGSMARSVSPTRPCDPTLPVNGKLIVAAVTPWSSSFFFFSSHPVAQLLLGHQPTRPVLNKGAPFFLSTIANNLKLN